MSYENKLERLQIQEESQVDTRELALVTSQANKYSPLMMAMRFEEHDASQVDKWLMIDLEEDFDATHDRKECTVH